MPLSFFVGYTELSCEIIEVGFVNCFFLRSKLINGKRFYFPTIKVTNASIGKIVSL